MREKDWANIIKPKPDGPSDLAKKGKSNKGIRYEINWLTNRNEMSLFNNLGSNILWNIFCIYRRE